MARWIFLAGFLLYYAVLAISSWLSYDKIVAGVLSGRIPRTQVYYSQMAGMWIPCAGLLALAAFGLVSFDEIGLGWVRLTSNAWLAAAAIILYIVYLTYLFISFRSMRRNSKTGKTMGGIPDRMRALYPASKKDKQVWTVVAVSAGITEELLFRGFLIGSVQLLFPTVPLLYALVFSSLLFGAGHLYQGARRAAAPALLGMMLGLFFIAFGSVLPGILAHALQDICAAYVMPEEQAPSATACE